MRFRLRTLMIVLALGPLVLAALWSAYDVAMMVAMLLVLLSLIVVPIWAGVRRAELIRQRRERLRFRT